MSDESIKKLSRMRARFVNNILSGMNQTEAALQAGYSEKTATRQGWSVLKTETCAQRGGGVKLIA